jgi:hypothetical protein
MIYYRRYLTAAKPNQAKLHMLAAVFEIRFGAVSARQLDLLTLRSPAISEQVALVGHKEVAGDPVSAVKRFSGLRAVSCVVRGAQDVLDACGVAAAARTRVGPT